MHVHVQTWYAIHWKLELTQLKNEPTDNPLERLMIWVCIPEDQRGRSLLPLQEGEHELDHMLTLSGRANTSPPSASSRGSGVRSPVGDGGAGGRRTPSKRTPRQSNVGKEDFLVGDEGEQVVLFRPDNDDDDGA